MTLPNPSPARRGDAEPAGPPAPPAPGGMVVRVLRMVALIIAGVLAISVSANAAGPAKTTSPAPATVTMGKVVATGDGAFVLPKNGSGVYLWSPDRDGWLKVGGPAKELYAAEDTVYVTNPHTGDVYKYNGKPDDWTKVSGPVAELAATNKHLYRITPDHTRVEEYTGSNGVWTKVGGPAAHLYTYTGKTPAMKDRRRGQSAPSDSPLYATDPKTGSIAKYDSPNKWSTIGGPGAQFAVTDTNLYGLAPDRSGILEWNGKTGTASKWTNIRNTPTERIVAANTLFAVNPGNGGIVKHSGNGKWDKIGGPAAAFAGSGDQLYGISPDGAALYRYTGDKKNPWKSAGSPVAAPASRADKLALLERLEQTGPAARDEWKRLRNEHLQGTPDRYEFKWSTNTCNVFPNKPLGYDFTLPCIRHDFGYRNFRDLLGEDAFRSGKNGPSPKDRVDKIFRQDMDSVCDGRSWCHKTALTYYGGVQQMG
ncbi:phospholipase A2 [Kitasatospora sp. NPDC058406]|uniref:phospholipase A2 n=1 Tax=Kitasatospora sp. NPDC058406 TaxID=3346483 RepID=UPI003647206D